MLKECKTFCSLVVRKSLVLMTDLWSTAGPNDERESFQDDCL